MNFSKKLIIAFLASILCGYSGVFAAGLDHFKVNFNPTTAKIGESLDLTIEAVDKNNTTILDYDGTILIFSESDPDAVLPSALEENTYTFSPADQGKIKFENSVQFKLSGTQNIHIYDLNDDTVFGVAEVEIAEEEAPQNIEINIISPENGLTIGNNSISISGKTGKNHQVKIIVNNQEEFLTISNRDGIYEKLIDNLKNGENTFKAQVLDADLNVIGESSDVNINVELDNLNIKNVKITPESIDPENSFEIEVITNPNLTEVSVILNDVLTLLEETKKGVYSAKIYAPKEAGTYKIDVKIKDELGHEKTELGAGSIIVNQIELKAAKEPVIIKEEASVQTNNENKELKITGLKLVELKSKSILTWNKVEGAESYNVYKKIKNGELELIDNVKKTKFEVEIIGDEIKYDYFAIRALAKTASGELYEGSLSDATKVKTGPEILILLLLSLFIGGAMIILKQNKA